MPNDFEDVINLNEDDNAVDNSVSVEETTKKGKSGKKSDKKPEKEKSVLRELISWVLTFAVAIGLALILKNYVIINANVPTGSMENTIMTGDDLFGFRLAYLNSDPQRGDVIIFKYPDDETQKYVKRIIGLPGETVVIDEAKVYIDGKEFKEDYLKEEWVCATGPFEFKVPEDCYLVLGDNRNDSLDARYWTNQYVAKDKIIGKAIFIYFPFDRMGTID